RYAWISANSGGEGGEDGGEFVGGGLLDRVVAVAPALATFVEAGDDLLDAADEDEGGGEDIVGVEVEGGADLGCRGAAVVGHLGRPQPAMEDEVGVAPARRLAAQGELLVDPLGEAVAGRLGAALAGRQGGVDADDVGAF